MVILYIGAGAAAAKNNNNVTPTLPSGLQVGNLMLCFASARGNGALGTPTNWTQKWQLSHSSVFVHKIALFYKFYATGDIAPTVTYTGGVSGDTIIGQVCAFSGVDRIAPFNVQGATSSNSPQPNIGPISGIVTGPSGKLIIVFGHRADDWTSVDTLSGDGLVWAEIGEPDSTLGNDAGEVWDYAISGSGGYVTVTSKTFTVTDGSQTGIGMMQSLNEVMNPSFRRLRYYTESPPPSDSQESFTTVYHMYSGSLIRCGQRKTIPNQPIYRLEFVLAKSGSPTGNVYFRVRRVSNDSIIQEVLWGDASALPGGLTPTWCYVNFASPSNTNEEVRLTVEYSGGNSSNYVGFWGAGSVKAGEQMSQYISSWIDNSSYDATYKVYYSPPFSGWNKLRYASEPQITGAWNKLLYLDE